MCDGESGYPPIEIKEMIKAGCRLSYIEICRDLCNASRLRRLAVVEGLIAAGGAVDNADSNGCAALHFAGIEGQFYIIDALVKHGASVDKAAFQGYTALHATCNSGQPKAAEALFWCLVSQNRRLNQ